MPRNSNGFKSTGGRPPLSARQAPQYTPAEISAMSKLSSVDESRTGAGIGGDPNHVILCRICGRPLSADSPYAREGDKFSYHEEARAETHFRCQAVLSARNQKLAEEKAAEAEAKLTAEEKAAREEEMARKFNESGGIINDGKPLSRPDPYTFKKGERPIEKGLTSEKFEFKPEDDPTILEQTRLRQEEEAAEFARYQAEIENAK